VTTFNTPVPTTISRSTQQFTEQHDKLIVFVPTV